MAGFVSLVTFIDDRLTGMDRIHLERSHLISLKVYRHTRIVLNETVGLLVTIVDTATVSGISERIAFTRELQNIRRATNTLPFMDSET